MSDDVSTSPVLIQGSGLTKVYGEFVALNEASISVRAGEVRALIGSNGAGKSTLIKILTGAVAPTRGTVDVAGEPVTLGDPREMIRHGVACIYQHSNLAPAMTVLDNIYLGRQPTRALNMIDARRQRTEAKALLDRHGLEMDLSAIVGDLPTVKQKEVEILKALALDARVILMDEPTGWLANSEVAKLHATIRRLKANGVGIVYISHILDEIFAVCDTMTIMRDGRVIAENAVKDMDRPRVVQLMVGEKLAQESANVGLHKRKAKGTGEVRLGVRNLSKHRVFEDISFDVHAGEIFCLTGLIGSKRTELVRTLFGADHFDSGQVMLDGQSVRFTTPSQAMARGLGFVPEDRHRDGLMLGMTVAENLAMATLDRLRNGILLSGRRIRDVAGDSITALSIQPPDGRRVVRLLSGGNQQKTLLGKWLARSPRVIILDEPTVGVDVGAKAEIYGILRRERDRGAAVLVVSSDLEEVLSVADRIGVMVAGRLKTIRDAEAVDMNTLVEDIGSSAT